MCHGTCVKQYVCVSLSLCVWVHGPLFLFTFSRLREVLNAFAKHTHTHTHASFRCSTHYADDSAYAANTKDISLLYLLSFWKLFLSHFLLYVAIFVAKHLLFVFFSAETIGGCYLTFFVVIFIYIKVKYSLCLCILLHLGFVLLCGLSHKNGQRKGLVVIGIASAIADAIAAAVNVVNALTIDLFTGWTNFPNASNSADVEKPIGSAYTKDTLASLRMQKKREFIFIDNSHIYRNRTPHIYEYRLHAI